MGLQSRQQGQNVIRSLRAVILCGLIMAGIVIQPAAAIDYNAEIKKLQAEQQADAGARTDLQGAALTLEQKLANLRATIASLDAQINLNQRAQTDLTTKIAAATQQIADEHTNLGKLIRQMYIESDISTLEMVASSDTFSHFVEKEQHGIAMQTRIKETLDRINALKKQQEQQKAEVDKLLADNKSMQTQVAAERQEVDRLLAMNVQQQSEYTQSIAAASTQISDLQRQQAEENLRFQQEQARLAEAARRRAAANPAAAQYKPAPPPAGLRAINGAAYPFANAPFPNEIVDPWGMYKRQCVSYTAWAVAASGRYMPYWGGRGNAKQWDDNARAAGIPVDGNPRVGDVAVSNRGTYGHVMYVDAVNGDGSINISQYNAGWDGRYSTARIFPGDLVFIHF